jgi:signal transduction histidine kinase
MPLPNQPVTLTAEQVAELNSKLSNMRHHINNKLATIIGAVEVIRMKPETMERMMQNLVGQPLEIRDSVDKFSTEFEQVFGITRP